MQNPTLPLIKQFLIIGDILIGRHTYPKNTLNSDRTMQVKCTSKMPELPQMLSSYDPPFLIPALVSGIPFIRVIMKCNYEFNVSFQIFR